MNRTSMTRARAYAQWKHQRAEITVFTVVAALIAPSTVFRAIVTDESRGPYALLSASATVAVLAAAIATLMGFLLAVRPYMLDMRAQHTYALSLPVPREEYALLRVWSGLALLLLPTAGFLIGALVAAQASPASNMLHAYPIGLTLRFLLAAAFSFALGFGIQYGLGRKAARWIVIVALTIGGVEIAGQLLFHDSLTAPLWDLLANDASPLRIFATRWNLFDV